MKSTISAICIAILCMINTGNGYAQDTEFGVKGGLSLTSITYGVSVFGFSVEETTSKKVGFAAGVFMEKPFSDLISGRVEALYVQKGGTGELEDFGDGNLTLSYLDIPVLAEVNIPLESSIQPYIYGGGFAGYLLDATADSDDQVVDEVGVDEFLKDLNYGLLLGAGASYGKWSFDLRYDIGLANIFNDDAEIFGELEEELEETDEFGEFGDINDLLGGIDLSTGGFYLTVGYSF